MTILLHRQFLDEIIESLVMLGNESDAVLGLVLLGSLARSDLKVNSDVDFCYVVKPDSMDQLKHLVLQLFSSLDRFKKLLDIVHQERVVGYFVVDDLKGSVLERYPIPIFKAEVFFAERNEVLLDYLQKSVISLKKVDWEKIILLDKKESLRRYLVSAVNKLGKDENLAAVVVNKVFDFLEAFEEASRAHGGGDSYRYVMKMNKAFHHLLVLHYLTKGIVLEGDGDVKYALERLPMHESSFFRELLPTADLQKANFLKKRYHHHFVKLLKALSEKYYLKESDVSEWDQFCGIILKRDCFWNFRDVSLINPEILKSGVLYRSAYLFSNDITDEFARLLLENNIKTVIDLRMSDELDDDELASYKQFLSELGIKHVNIPFDPQKYRPGDVTLRYLEYADERQYRPVLYEILPRYLTSELREVYRALITNETSILVHCHAGKDRTGMIMAILLCYLGLSEEEVILDYRLASPDVESKLIRVLLTVIEEYGTARDYLKCHVGLSQDELTKLEKLLKKETEQG